MTAQKTFEAVKIFGERNTSTNAMKKLVELNSAAKVLSSVYRDLPETPTQKASGMPAAAKGVQAQEAFIDHMFTDRAPTHHWKHTATYFDDISAFEDCFTIIMVRDPASWLRAFLKRPYHALRPFPKQLAKFILHPWQTAGREGLDQVFLPPVEIWNRKMRSYADFTAKLEQAGYAYAYVKFEDFACDQAQVFDGIKGNLAAAADAVTIIEGSTKDKDKNADYYRRYYGEKLWLEDIGPKARKLINKWIDWDLAGRFGYDPLSLDHSQE